MKGDKCVEHRSHGDEGEEPRAYPTDAVAKIEKADSQAAQDDGEVEPGEEGALIGEEDLGLDPRRKGDSFSGSSRQERLGGHVVM